MPCLDVCMVLVMVVVMGVMVSVVWHHVCGWGGPEPGQLSFANTVSPSLTHLSFTLTPFVPSLSDIRYYPSDEAQLPLGNLRDGGRFGDPFPEHPRLAVVCDT